MSNKADFHGDVGQAVMGSVNEAPRLSNVVHVNLTGAAAKTPQLTNLQRKSITNKVKDLVAVSELEPLDVYRVILADFGVENMDKFPRDRYKDAIALLDGWMAELQNEVLPPVAALADSRITHCNNCIYHARQARHGRMMMVAQTVAILAITAIFSWLWWRQPAEARSANRYCHIDGKTYSIGSGAKMTSGALRECLANVNGNAPLWGAPSKERAK